MPARAFIALALALATARAGAATAESLATAVELARVPEEIRGYGHVKLANVATVRAQWQDLLRHATGKPLDPGDFTEHLRGRYLT